MKSTIIQTTAEEQETYTLRIKSKNELFHEQLMQSQTRHVYDPNNPDREERAFQERIKKLTQGIQK